MKSTTLVALAAAMAFSLPAQDGGKAVTDAAAKPATTGTSVGVVDFAKVIDQYAKFAQGSAEIEKKRELLLGQLKALRSEIAEKVEALRSINQDSEEALDRSGEIELLRGKQKLWEGAFERKLELDRARLLFEVYQDLEVAVAKVAKARGVDVVLRLHAMDAVDLAKLQPRSLGGRLDLFERRMVWYSSESVDLTNDVIKLMMVPLSDKEKKDGKVGEKPTSPAPAPTPKSGG